VPWQDQDQRWTLARVATLIAGLLHGRYTLRGTSSLLHRLGSTLQVSIHRAAGRDEQAIAAWKGTTWVNENGLGNPSGTDVNQLTANHQEPAQK